MFQYKLAVAMKRRRKEMGISQEQLAELIEKSTAFVGQLERGDSLPGIETLGLIIRRLGIDANYLFSDEFSSDDEDLSRVLGLIAQMSPRKRKMIVKIVTALFDSDD